MIPLTAMTSAKPSTSPWMASLYGGIFTGLITAAFSLLLPMSIPVLYGITLLLIGVGPVLGYQLAAGKLGSDWKSILGGIIGMIFLPIFFLTWPLFVWLFNRSAYSAGRLFLGSIIGIILGIIVFFIIGLTIGQDPSWVGFGGSMLMAFWGGASAAFMVGREA